MRWIIVKGADKFAQLVDKLTKRVKFTIENNYDGILQKKTEEEHCNDDSIFPLSEMYNM